MADSSVNSNGNALPYYKEKKPSVHFSDRFTITSSDGSVHYDKEMLKRTMLVHEATFRKQVYELHRLYKTQKELMAQLQRKEFSCSPRYADALQPGSSASQVQLGEVKGVCQTATLISGHDLKQSSIDLINESSSQYSVSGAPLRHKNVRCQKKFLNLQLPADVYADDDDDVEILEVRPLKSSPWAIGSVLGRNVNLNLEHSEGSSHMEKSWITDIQAHHSSPAHMLNKPVEESSMKITDVFGVGIPAFQNQHYTSVSQGVDQFLSLEGKLKEKYVGKISGSRFFAANEDIRQSNSLRQKRNESNSSMAWYPQNSMGSSMEHYPPSASTFNHLIFAPPSFNHAVNPSRQSNNTSYLTKSHYGAVETSITKHAHSSGILMDSTPTAPYHHSPKIHEAPDQKLPPLHRNLKDIDLNDAPVDTVATWEQQSDKSMVDISWLCKKPVSLMKSEVPSSNANGHSQTLPNPTFYSEQRTPMRVPCFPLSVASEKDSTCSPTVQYDLNIGSSIKSEADMELQPQRKEVGTDIRNLIDLNEALPIMDDPEMDACGSGELVPREPNDPSSDSLAIKAAENLVAICNVVVQPASPQVDTLHWFADLATSKENTTLDKDSDDDFEALTLKLQETKSNEYHSTPRATQEDNRHNGPCSAASLLIPKPQRGKGRGRRQRKDFHRDVLPCIASLQKNEVSEDLCALGRPKPVTPSKRGGRNGQQPRARRRVRRVAVAMAVEEAEVSPPPPSPSVAPADLDADALGVTRWGRTTRRCRRPRCPPANNASLRVA
ncbi:hypothetical protein HU200_003436 [Digitaria exilis]|uniref:Uncharacterized protein n=1 Tax=Digitaria exilis TaxID=1010633 RepID=A0A835KUU6_9POAL|nr:hypothetical protein HU200_003436 [Digitaria exilis]